MKERDELEALYARIGDLCRKAEKGDVGISDFLSPRERYHAEKRLRELGAIYFFDGGYASAERQRAYVLPEYAQTVSSLEEIEEYGFASDICALSVRTDGYRALCHRDYLGSVLGLGIERSSVGDILVFGDKGESAVILCAEAVGAFILSYLSKISTEKVRVERSDIKCLCVPEKRTERISDTVASPRLDCVVGALCSLSREKARAVVESGLVELDFESAEKADRAVSAPCMLSVRGYGRYRIESLGEKTKKGRYRLSAEKYL